MFEGSMVAIVTPFKNGKVDEKALRGLIEFQIRGGTQAIVPCGTTGESATLSHAEHDEVVGITVDACKGRVKVLAGTGSNSTSEAAELTLVKRVCTVIFKRSAKNPGCRSFWIMFPAEHPSTCSHRRLRDWQK